MKLLIKKSRDAIKANLIPGLILQALGLIIVVSYYQVPFVNNLCQELSELKTRSGIIFSGISTCIAGGLIPVTFLILTKKIPKDKAIKHGLFYILFWLWKGLEIDIFYRYQALWFGDEPSFKVISYKVLIDQLVWNPFYAAPCISLVFFWKDCDFSFSTYKKKLTRDMFFINIPTVLVSTWIVWFPMCAIIYSLPTPLQVPLFNIVLCFFVLLVSILTKPETEAEKAS